MTEWVNYTDSFRLALERFDLKQREILKSMFLHYRAQYEKLCEENPGDAKSVAYNFLEEIDKFVKQTLKEHDRKTSCKKGCNFCCYTKVAVSSDEAELLVEAAKEEGIEFDLTQLSIHNGIELTAMPYELRKCPVLGPDGSCRLYKYRPAVCRTLNVASDPKLCDTHTVADVERMISVEAEAIVSGMWSAKDNKEVDDIQRMIFKELTK
jgi:Fe-S-cluster containining protein